MPKRFVSFAALSMLALIALAACGGTTTERASEQVTRIPVQGAPIYASPAADTAQAASGTPARGAEVAAAGSTAAPSGGGGSTGPSFMVTAKDISFDPKTLEIPAGSDVTVTLPNEGALPHNFSIDALSIKVDLPAGEKDLKTTINAAAGSYEYYCDIPGHKEAGMDGTLTVK